MYFDTMKKVSAINMTNDREYGGNKNGSDKTV